MASIQANDDVVFVETLLKQHGIKLAVSEIRMMASGEVFVVLTDHDGATIEYWGATWEDIINNILHSPDEKERRRILAIGEYIRLAYLKD